jgi:PAS domain-containing protein
VHYDGVVPDITEQKRREGELAEREARYRTIAESAQDGIVTMDAGSTIQFANLAVESILGYAPEELIGESMTMLMPERRCGDGPMRADCRWCCGTCCPTPSSTRRRADA